jgi:hypothetical protein
MNQMKEKDKVRDQIGIKTMDRGVYKIRYKEYEGGDDLRIEKCWLFSHHDLGKKVCEFKIVFSVGVLPFCVDIRGLEVIG